MKDPTKNPVWEEVATCLKPLLRLVKGEIGVFLIKREESVAAIVVSQQEEANAENLAEAVALFRDRLKDMESHAKQGDLDFKLKSQAFVRDETTGEYTKIPPPGNPDN